MPVNYEFLTSENSYHSTGIVTDGDVIFKWMSLKNNASRRGKPFTLGFNDVKRLLNTQKCFYTGEELKFDTRSVDCVDPEKGYVQGNVVMCSTLLNNRKTNLTVDEIRAIYKGMKRKGLF